MEKSLKNITGETLILGFTGALGSGCTFYCDGLNKFHNYLYFGLSEPIHKKAKELDKSDSFQSLQDIGNELRQKGGHSVLARLALERADKDWGATHSYNDSTLFNKPSGIVLDGIRNVAEIELLRQFPNFYLFSIQSEREERKQRLLRTKRCKSAEEFEEADERDAEEKTVFGQQVNRCNDLSDIIIINDNKINTTSDFHYRNYIDNSIYKKHIIFIEKISILEKPPYEYKPSVEEMLMTAAYVSSKRSSCLKRKVGAIIAVSSGDIISSGYNEVPNGALPCFEEPDLNWCFRDRVQEEMGVKYLFCPNCGERINLKFKCSECGIDIQNYSKVCPKCKKDPHIEYICPKCRIDIFSTFLPGKGSKGKLLDVCRAVHAEENAILNLSRYGVTIPKSSTLFSTTFPCNLCANKIVNSGIERVVFSEPYTIPEAKRILEGNDVKIERFQGVKNTAYFKLFR